MTADIIDLAAHRESPGTAWITYVGQCIGCAHQAIYVAPIPEWAEAASTPDCHKCGAVRAVLPRRDEPEAMNDGSETPWAAPGWVDSVDVARLIRGDL